MQSNDETQENSSLTTNEQTQDTNKTVDQSNSKIETTTEDINEIAEINKPLESETKPNVELSRSPVEAETEKSSNTPNEHESSAKNAPDQVSPIMADSSTAAANYTPIGDCDDNIQFQHPQIQSAIQEIRRLLSSEEYKVEVDPESDIQLAYFLLGYHLDVQASAKAYKETLKWQEDNGVAAIRKAVRDGLHYTEFPNYEIIQNTFPHDLSSSDITCSNGMPVAITRLGITDLTKLSTVVTLQEFMIYMIHVFEKRLMIMEEYTKRTGYLCRYVDIHDLHCPRGLFSTFSTNNVGYFKWWLMTLAPHYPEQVRKVFVVNVPMLFSVGWKVTKVWLPNRTQSKIEILGGNYKNTLEKLMDTQLLPTFLGGKGGWPSNAEQIKSPLSPVTPLKS